MEEAVVAERDFSANWSSEPLPSTSVVTLAAAAGGVALVAALTILSKDPELAMRAKEVINQ